MKLHKVALEFTAEELEAIHYAMHIGIKKYQKNKCHTADDWIAIAESIRKRLPIAMRIENING